MADTEVTSEPSPAQAPTVPSYDVVMPTVGRPSLPSLLASLAASLPADCRVLVVDDRAAPVGPLVVPDLDGMLDDPRIEVVPSDPAGREGGRGPAAARNTGWRRSDAEWIVFLDDDVDLPVDWVRNLEDDLRRAGPDDGVVESRLRVPLPPGRRPTDWERNVRGLETAQWVTADLAVRRRLLVELGGFDERFPRAYREDAELALRVLDTGWRLARGRRRVRHPVRSAPWWVSVPLQRGNGDDVLLERLHGPGWRQRLDVPPGTYRSHRVTTGAAVLALAARLAGRRRLARLAASWWAWRTARFAWARIAPGPRTSGEVLAMVATSAAIPPAACFHRAAAQVRWRTNVRS